MYTSLGVITKGTVIEVNISELGLVTQGGKVIWGLFVFTLPLLLCYCFMSLYIYLCFTPIINSKQN